MRPPDRIPQDLYDAYTMNGRVAVGNWYIDSADDGVRPIHYAKDAVDELVAKATAHGLGAYKMTDPLLYDALNTYSIRGARVAVIGSVCPWYEAICMARGAKEVVTVEYNERTSDHPNLKTMGVVEFYNSQDIFDVAMSISSLEHDGLGRYGDPLDPDADLKAMQMIYQRLRPGGMLFLAVPIGVDKVVWNAHRIYGRIRLPMLTSGWAMTDRVGFSDLELGVDTGIHVVRQPIMVLTK